MRRVQPHLSLTDGGLMADRTQWAHAVSAKNPMYPATYAKVKAVCDLCPWQGPIRDHWFKAEEDATWHDYEKHDPGEDPMKGGDTP